MQTPKLSSKLFLIILIVAFFIRCSPSRDAEPPLHDAALRGNVKKVEELIRSGVNVNSRNGEGATPLHWAAYKGQLEVAKILLMNGAKINDLTTKGTTPLRLAMDSKETEMIRYLTSQGGLEDVDQ